MQLKFEYPEEADLSLFKDYWPQVGCGILQLRTRLRLCVCTNIRIVSMHAYIRAYSYKRTCVCAQVTVSVCVCVCVCACFLTIYVYNTVYTYFLGACLHVRAYIPCGHSRAEIHATHVYHKVSKLVPKPCLTSSEAPWMALALGTVVTTSKWGKAFLERVRRALR